MSSKGNILNPRELVIQAAQNLAQSDFQESSEHRTQTLFDSRKLLDSSLNNRLQLLPDNSQSSVRNAPHKSFRVVRENQLHMSTGSGLDLDLDRRPAELFDLALEDHKAFNHSGIVGLFGQSTKHYLQKSRGAVSECGSDIMPRIVVPIRPIPIHPKPMTKIEPKQQCFQYSQNQKWLDRDQAESQQQAISAVYPEATVFRAQHMQNSLPSKLVKNETKNIPKNYGKAIITFIQKHREKVEQLLARSKVSYSQFMTEFKSRKKSINTIQDLKDLWLDCRFSLEMRILSNLFLRKYSLQYIFNSRITNYASHIKYRHKLRQALKNPTEFKNIKDY